MEKTQQFRAFLQSEYDMFICTDTEGWEERERERERETSAVESKRENEKRRGGRGCGEIEREAVPYFFTTVLCCEPVTFAGGVKVNSLVWS